MNNVNKSAFTLIEIVVAISIMVVLMGMATRFVSFGNPEAKIVNIVSSINNVVFLTKQNVIVSNKLHRLVFSKNELKVQVEKEMVGSKVSFEDFVSSFSKAKFKFPPNFDLFAIYSNGKRVEDDKSGFFYIDISRNGILPFLFVQFSIEDRNGASEKYTLRSQPFLGYFELESGWIKE